MKIFFVLATFGVAVIRGQDDIYADQLRNWAQLSRFEKRGGTADTVASASIGSESTSSDLSYAPSNSYGKSPQRRRNRYRYKKLRSKLNEARLDDDYYYDRDSGSSSGYDAPSSGYDSPSTGYVSSPSQGYDAPSSYNAPSSYKAPSHEAPSYEAQESYNAPSYGGGDKFGDFLSALAAFLPIGLFLAAIPPNLITVKTRKKRSGEDVTENLIQDEWSYPFLDKISEMGFDKLNDDECQKKILCEMSVFGQTQPNANRVQRTLHRISEITPRYITDLIGMTEVFEAAQNHNCQNAFHC